MAAELTLSKSRSVAMVVSGIIVMIFAGAIYTWTIMRTYISAVFPEMTSAQLSFNFTLMITVYCVCNWLSGKLSRRFNQKNMLRSAGAIVLLGYLIVSTMPQFSGTAALLVMYLGYGVIGGMGTGFIYNCIVSGVGPWFPERMGLVSGLLLMGYGIGSLFLGLLAQQLIKVMSVWAIFRIFGVSIFVVCMIGSFILRSPPVKQINGESAGHTTGEMLKKSSFWIFFLWMLCNNAEGLMLINASSSMAVYYGAAASLGLVVSVFNGGFRPVIGWMTDKTGVLKGMLIVNCLSILAGIMLVFISYRVSIPVLVLGFVITGIVYGGSISQAAKFIRESYGPKCFGENVGFSSLSSIPASLLGPFISGALQDRAGGDYRTTYMMMLLLAVISVLFILPLSKALKKENESNRS